MDKLTADVRNVVGKELFARFDLDFLYGVQYRDADSHPPYSTEVNQETMIETFLIKLARM